MAETTKIKWAHHTWNPWRGCRKCAVGCKNCYATRRGGARYFGNSPRIATAESGWKLPHKYNRAAEKAGERRRIFPSLCDPFEDAMPVVDGKGKLLGTTEKLRSLMFRLIGDTPWLDWLLLTKRPQNIRGMLPHWWRETDSTPSPENLWLGVSCSTQKDVSLNSRLLLASGIDAGLFLSLEPLLEPVTIPQQIFDWVIVGGESGHKARPCNVEWIRSILKQCWQVKVPCFVKQLGTNVCWRMSKDYPYCSDCDALLRLKHAKGADPAEWPADLRAQEIPK